MWACIGTAVLLGAWTLSVAIKGTIDDISGGGVVSGGGGGGPCGGGSGSPTPQKLDKNTVAAFCSTEEAQRELMAGSATMDGDTMDRYKLESSDPNLLSKSFAIAQNLARTNNFEQSFVFVQYQGGGGVFAHTNSGSMASTPVVPISTIQKSIIDTSIVPIESIHIIHTHPSLILRGDTDAPPSLPDLVHSYEYSRRLGVPIITEAADPNGVWRYSVPSSSAVGKHIELSEQFAKLPEVQDLAKSLGDTDICSPDSMKKFDDLRYSPSSFAVVKDLSSVSGMIQPLSEQDAEFDKVFNNPTADDSDTRRIAEILRQRLETEKDIGIDVRRVFP